MSHERAANYVAAEMLHLRAPRLAPAILWRRANLTCVPTVGLGSVCEFDGNEIVTDSRLRMRA